MSSIAASAERLVRSPECALLPVFATAGSVPFAYLRRHKGSVRLARRGQVPG